MVEPTAMLWKGYISLREYHFEPSILFWQGHSFFDNLGFQLRGYGGLLHRRKF